MRDGSKTGHRYHYTKPIDNGTDCSDTEAVVDRNSGTSALYTYGHQNLVNGVICLYFYLILF